MVEGGRIWSLSPGETGEAGKIAVLVALSIVPVEGSDWRSALLGRRATGLTEAAELGPREPPCPQSAALLLC